ncbi:unnamed protein product, partial [Ectocarpus sp. 4 AP-2014]
QILSLSESKEASSSYGKGDVWALSETGRFLDGANGSDDVVFCRQGTAFCLWHGVSSQGMLSVGPLGDHSEALRLEAMAGGGASGGGGGSSSARSIRAIRCFNAQTDLSALDLLRNGRLRDDDDDDDGNGKSLATATAGNALGRGKGLLDLASVPVLRFLLSGGLAPDDCNSSGNNNSSSNNTSINSNSNSSKIGGSSNSSSSSSSGERVFDLCLTRRERNAEVSQTVEAFRLNRDQARLLWRCATWFRPAEAAGESDNDGESDEDDKDGAGTRERDEEEKEEDQEQGRPTKKGRGGMAGEDGAPVVLVHGVFGAGKSLTLVALCVVIDRIATADARLRPSRGLAPRPKAVQVRVLLASGTNVAVDRVLMGLVSAGFDDIARIGSHRRTHKSLLERVVHSRPPGRDAQKAVQSELQAMLKTAVGAERDEIGRALQASKAESFAADQARRLHEARVTGVTCASATVPLLTRPPRSPRPLPRGGVGSGGNDSNDSVTARKTGVATGGAKTTGPWRRPAGVAGSNGRLLGGGRGNAGARGWSGGGGEGGRRGYDIVVLDECSQIVEPMSLLPVAVAQPRRLVLVGDPMQLPPPVARAR